MTDQELNEIEARAEAATAGPWSHSPAYKDIKHGGFAAQVWGPNENSLACMDALTKQGSDDAAFIAHARTDVPALVAEVRRLRAELRRLQPGDPECRKCDGRGEYEVFDEDHGPLQSRLLECDCRRWLREVVKAREPGYVLTQLRAGNVTVTPVVNPPPTDPEACDWCGAPGGNRMVTGDNFCSRCWSMKGDGK